MPRLAVFLHGTAIMHASGATVAREECVEQVRRRTRRLRASPTTSRSGPPVEKLRTWAAQGAEIVYLSSHRRTVDVDADRSVVARHGFPVGPVEARETRRRLRALVLRVQPDVLVEDDCESIGGAPKMIAPRLPNGGRARIVTIAVPEFGGIDHLPDGPRHPARTPSESAVVAVLRRL